jgi:hypothetical protein
MGLKTISPAGLHQAMQDEPVTAIDVNFHQSWVKARVPGALNLDPAGYEEKSLPADKNSLLVFYCSNPLCRKAPMRPAEPNRWATAMCMSCRRVSAAGSMRNSRRSLVRGPS